MIRRYLLAFILTALAVPAPCLSDGDPAIGISVWAANQPNAPLHVIGFVRGSKRGRGIEIVLKNDSKRRINSFRVEAAVRNPCGRNADEPTWYSGSALNRIPMAPDSTAQAQEQVADTTILVTARRLKSPFLHVQVGVVEVTFQDGSTWKNQYPDASGLFDPSLAKSDVNACSSWPTPESALDKLHGDLTIVRDPAAGSVSFRPNGYLLTCVLKQGKAFCPTF